MKITASDGESRVIKAGEIILVEDTTGKGHLSQSVDGKGVLGFHSGGLRGRVRAFLF